MCEPRKRPLYAADGDELLAKICEFARKHNLEQTKNKFLEACPEVAKKYEGKLLVKCLWIPIAEIGEVLSYELIDKEDYELLGSGRVVEFYTSKHCWSHIGSDTLVAEVIDDPHDIDQILNSGLTRDLGVAENAADQIRDKLSEEERERAGSESEGEADG